MKKILSLLLALLMVFSLAACASSEEPADDAANDATNDATTDDTANDDATTDDTSENTPDAGKNPLEGLKTLGDIKTNGESFKILAVHDSVAEFHVTFYQGALYAADEMMKNYDLDLTVDFKAGSGTVTDMAEFNGIIEQGVNEGYDAIMCPSYNGSSCESTWQYAKDNGVPIFAWWTERVSDYDDVVAGWCVNDQNEQCTKVTDYMINYALDQGATPKVVIMSQGNTDNETVLVNYITEVCEKYDVEVKTVIVTTDSATQIEAISNAYQADPSWNVWISGTGEAGVSAATVFKEFGVMDQMYVAGIDAMSTHLDNIADGSNVCLLEQGVYSAGYISCYQAVDYLLDGKLDSLEYEEVTANDLVTKDNYEAWRSVSDIVLEAINSSN
jgi:ABC-type sugar transport system substrate-binding protein